MASQAAFMKLEKCFSSILSRWRLSGSTEGSSDDVRHCQVLFRDGERAEEKEKLI